MMLFIFYVLLFTFPLPLSLVSYSHLEAWLGAPALALYTSATVALSDRLEVKGCKIVRKLHVNEVLHLVGASLAQRAVIIRIRIRMRMITARAGQVELDRGPGGCSTTASWTCGRPRIPAASR